MSTLYDTIIVACLDDVFSFTIIAEWLKLKLIKFVFVISMPDSCSWISSFTKVLTVLLQDSLNTTLKWLNLPHLWHLSPYARHYPGLCSCLQYLHLFLVIIVLFTCFVSLSLLSLCVLTCIKVFWFMKSAYYHSLGSLSLYSFCLCQNSFTGESNIFLTLS